MGVKTVKTSPRFVNLYKDDRYLGFAEKITRRRSDLSRSLYSHWEVFPVTGDRFTSSTLPKAKKRLISG